VTSARLCGKLCQPRIRMIGGDFESFVFRRKSSAIGVVLHHSYSLILSFRILNPGHTEERSDAELAFADDCRLKTDDGLLK